MFSGDLVDPKVEDVARRFLDEVRSLLKDKVVAVIAFGSRVWGHYTEDSDYDLMLIHRANQREAEVAAAEAALKVSAELRVGVEPIVVSAAEFEGNDKYVIIEGKKRGMILYPDGDGNEAKKREAIDLLLLAEEFLEIAKALLKMNMYRGVLDEAYNASELSIKALLMWNGHSIPGSHGGLIGEFGRLYVLTGKADREMGRALSLALEKRNKARYDPRAEITEEDALKAIKTAEKTIKYVKEKLK